jgi:hypothetical protein
MVGSSVLDIPSRLRRTTAASMSMVMTAPLVRASLGRRVEKRQVARTHFGVAAANKRDGVARLHHAHRMLTVTPRRNPEAEIFPSSQ